MAFDLDPSYKQVPERIADFKAKHPEGCLRPLDPARPYWFEEVGDKTFLVYAAAAYRSPEDELPGIGLAWEPFPGRTPYTKDSELQNAETSAWGRSIVAVLASESKTVASAEDVRNRKADQDAPPARSTTRQPPATETGEMATNLVVTALHDRIDALPEASRREMGETWKAAGLSRLEVGRFLASDADDVDRLIAAQEAREVNQESPQTALGGPVGGSSPDPGAQDPTTGLPGLPDDIDQALIDEVMGDVEAMDEKHVNTLLREHGYSVAGGIRAKRVRLFQVLATERHDEAKVAF